MPITMGVTSTPVTFTKDFVASDAAIQDILDWAKENYAPQIQAQFNPTNDPAFVPTNVQVWRVLQKSWIAALRDAVRRRKQDAATTAAAAAVVDISIV